MRTLIVAILVLLAVTAARYGPRAYREVRANASSGCGYERWAVKTLTDTPANVRSPINFSPIRSSVARLRRLHGTDGSSSRQPAERRTYRLQVRLLASKLEPDGDIHLAIADPDDPTQTMIAELPAAYCEPPVGGANVRPRFRWIDQARVAFVAACGAPSSRYRTLAGTGTITGVLFLDFVHGQRSVAPNGAEIHPLLGFRLTSATC